MADKASASGIVKTSGRDSVSTDRLAPVAPPMRAAVWGAELALLALGAWAYWPDLQFILAEWNSNPDYGHGFLVVPIAGWFLWARRDRRPVSTSRMAWGGLVPLVMAGLLRIVAGRFYLPEASTWSIPIWLLGMTWLFHGLSWARWALPAIAFLWFGIPLPATLAIALSTPLQKIAAQLSAWTLRIVGQPAIAEGTTILLGEQVLDVERACSGLRMFFGTAALATAVAVLIRPARWRAGILLVATVPVAVAANVARVSATGLLMISVSTEAAQRFSHDFAAVLMIPLALAIFIGLGAFLVRIETRWRENAAAGATWLARWSAVAAILVTGLVYWGNRQQSQAFDALRETAERCQRDGEPTKAILYWARYLKACPTDDEAILTLADLMRRSASTPTERLRTVDLYRLAWERHPEKPNLGLTAASLAYQTGEFDTAIGICDRLSALSEKDNDVATKAVQLKADAMRQGMSSTTSRESHTWKEVQEALEDSIRVAGYEVRPAVSLADVYLHRLNEPGLKQREVLAGKVMDALVEHRPTDPVAWLARAQFRQESLPSTAGMAAKIDADLDKAVSLADAMSSPRVLPVYLAASQRSQKAGRRDEAVAFLQKAISAAPESYVAYRQLAAVQKQPPAVDGARQAIATLRLGLQKCQGQPLELILPLATALTETGDVSGAQQLIAPIETVIPRLTEQDRGTAQLVCGLIQSRVTAAREGIPRGVARLEKTLALPEVQMAGGETIPILAAAYATLGEWCERIESMDRAAIAFQQAGRLQPASTVWRLHAAAAAFATGDLEAAGQQYRRLASEFPKLVDVWLGIAGVEMQQQLRVSPKSRDWSRVDDAVKSAVQVGASGAAIAIVTAEKEAADGHWKEASQAVETALKERPKEPALWRALIFIQQRAGQLPEAMDSCRRYREAVTDRLDPAEQQARVLVAAKKPDEAMRLLQEQFNASQGVDRAKAGIALARLRLSLGDFAEAQKLLETAHQVDLGNIEIVDTLARLAWLRQDWEHLATYEGWLGSIESGDGGRWQFYRALRLLAEAKNTESPEFQEAVRLSQSLYETRPRWAMASLLQGEVAYRRGETDLALSCLERAWRYGGRNVLMADRLIDLLTQQGRFQDAQSYVMQMRDYLSVSSQFFDRAVPYYARSIETQEALQLAEDWVKRQPKDPFAHLRLGRVLLILAEKAGATERVTLLDRAEQAFRRAIELSPSDVRPWIACVMFYAEIKGMQGQAEAVIARCAEQVKLDPLRKTYVLAQMYEAVGMASEASIHYQKAMELSSTQPDNMAAVFARVAQFYLQRIPLLAEYHARQSLRLPQSPRLAKQVLMELLAKKEDSASIGAAIKLLAELGGSVEQYDAGQLRLYAFLLWKRNGTGDLDKAVSLLEGKIRKDPGDQRLLVDLYEASGRLAPAFSLLEGLIAGRDVQVQDLTAMLRFWQKHFAAEGKFEQTAAKAYSRLESLPGGMVESFRWRLRRETVKSAGKALSWEAIQSAMKAVAPTAAAGPAKQNDSNAFSGRFQQLLGVLLQEGHVTQALRLCDTPPAWMPAQKVLPQLCVAAAVVPLAAPAREEIDKYLSQAIARQPNDLEVLQGAGDFSFLGGKYAAAADLYTRLVAKEPTRSLARNNLALALLMVPGKQGEAERVLQEALRDRPNDLQLLDSKVVLDLALGRLEPAAATLRSARWNPSDPIRYLRQSQWVEAAKKSDNAMDPFLTALGLGLQRQILSPQDSQFMRDRVTEIEAGFSK